MSRAEEGQKVLNALLKRKTESGGLVVKKPMPHMAKAMEDAKKRLIPFVNGHTMDAAGTTLTTEKVKDSIRVINEMLAHDDLKYTPPLYDPSKGPDFGPPPIPKPPFQRGSLLREPSTATIPMTATEAPRMIPVPEAELAELVKLVDQNRTLQAHNKAQGDALDLWDAKYKAVTAERDALAAELTELKAILNETDFT